MQKLLASFVYGEKKVSDKDKEIARLTAYARSLEIENQRLREELEELKKTDQQKFEDMRAVFDGTGRIIGMIKRNSR